MDKEKDRFILILARKQGQAEQYASQRRLNPDNWLYVGRREDVRGRQHLRVIMLPDFWINTEARMAFADLKISGRDVVFEDDDF